MPCVSCSTNTKVSGVLYNFYKRYFFYIIARRFCRITVVQFLYFPAVNIYWDSMFLCTLGVLSSCATPSLFSPLQYVYILSQNCWSLDIEWLCITLQVSCSFVQHALICFYFTLMVAINKIPGLSIEAEHFERTPLVASVLLVLRSVIVFTSRYRTFLINMYCICCCFVSQVIVDILEYRVAFILNQFHYISLSPFCWLRSDRFLLYSIL